MKIIKNFFENKKPLFEEGGKYNRWIYVFEAFETLAFQGSRTTSGIGTHIKDGIDMKRLMMTVVIALTPALLFGMWNAGHQSSIATGEVLSFIEKLLIGVQLVLPMIAISYTAGLGTEFIFATIRRHEVNEGFLVTGILIPLIMPVTIPLWQVAAATIFGVIIAKEVFGGTGYNILNVALSARAFLYFAYPQQISGEVWTFLGDGTAVDGYSGATPLALLSGGGVSAMESATSSWAEGLYSAWNLFLGIMPGSIGETSTLMILIGAAILLFTGVASWKVMASVTLGTIFMGLVFNLIGDSITDPDLIEKLPVAFMQAPFYYHFIIGGWAFGTVFMATDPVTASVTETGKWIYGFLIGVFTVLIRIFNPAYPEGIMLAILLMNMFAPTIDYYVINKNKNRRLQRAKI